MRSKKFLMGIGVVIAALVFVFVGFSSKIYPAASVNGQMISAKALDETYQASFKYFSKVIDPAYVQEQGDRFALDVKRATLDTLIELKLVDQALEEIFEPEAVQQEALDRVAHTTTTEKTAEAVRELMGLSLEDFRRVVLVPEARRQLFEEELIKNGEDYAVWVKERRRAADVSIFLPTFAWTTGGTNCQSFCVEIVERTSILEGIKDILPSTSTFQEATSTPQ